MASEWQSKLARVSRMDWEEIRVRVGQELHKRGDLLKHRIGISSGKRRYRPSSEGEPSGQFFFSAPEIAERVELLSRHLAGEAADIVRVADEICAHRFRLLGYENLDFTPVGGAPSSRDIDWHLDPVHGKRAPLDPWFRIPFLDFSVVGDHKVTWELSRHQHLVTLAKARLMSGDTKYTRELAAQWHSWIEANPYPLGINWGSTLEVAFRSLSWIWVDQLLAGTSDCDEFRAEMLPALAFHGRYIERYLSTYFSPNTHLLGEAVALFFLGTLYPGMPRATRWRASAWKIVLHEAGRQVRPDGVYFEQSLHYHVYALDFFLHARLLASRNAMEIPPAYDVVLQRMLSVVEALAAAGPPEGFGDDDGGRVFNPGRNRTEHMNDPLALGALIYSKEFFAARLTEEALWLFGSKAVGQLDRSNSREQAPNTNSKAFREGGIYLLADSHPYTQAMVVDAGPQGVGRSGHGHADALSLRLAMDGRRWLVDGGSGVYIANDPAERNVFRGTIAHNTLRVDEADQAVASEPFSWTQIPTTRAEEWVVGKSFTYFVGSHNGYARLEDPVIHRRHILKIAGGMWLVRDVALGHAEHELEIRWHFAPDLNVNSAGRGRVEVAPVNGAATTAGLTLLVPEETVWQRGMEVTRTLISPAYGTLQPAPLVRCHARVLLPAETATAMVPLCSSVLQEQDARPAARFTRSAHAQVQSYKLESADESQVFFFALSGEEWTFGSWSSDARMLYCRIQQDQLAHLVILGGTRVAWQGKPLLTAAGSANFFEWRKHGVNSVPDGFSVTAWFKEVTWEAAAKGPVPEQVTDISSTYAEKR